MRQKAERKRMTAESVWNKHTEWYAWATGRILRTTTNRYRKKKGDGLPGVWGACDNQLCIALSTLEKKNFSEGSYSVWYVSKNSLDSAVKKMATLYTQILLDNIMCFNEMQEFREKEKVCVTEM